MFYPLLDVKDLYDGLVLPCQAAGKALLIVHRNQTTFVVDRFCPHQQFLLDQAPIDQHEVLTCPRHRFHYQLSTGQCLEGHFCLPHYPVQQQGGQVGVEL